MNTINFNKEDYLYTPFFCEENIWQLINTWAREGQPLRSMWVLIITNPELKLPLVNQQAAPKHQLIIWDYHVLLLRQIDRQWLIFDFDSRLPFATPLRQYLHSTFIHPEFIPKELTPYVRKISAQAYLDRFFSDRSHMLYELPQSQFPTWPIINADVDNHINLADYLDIKQNIDSSQVLKLTSLERLEQWLVNSQ